MQLERLIAALAPTDVVGRAAVETRELAYDAREVPRGSLFFCIRGASADGHEYAADAVRSGAAALVVERRLAPGRPPLRLPPRRAAAAPAFALRAHARPRRSSTTRPQSCLARPSPARTGRRRPPPCCGRSSTRPA